MADRAITSVAWHQRTHVIEVVYAEGEPDHLEGAHHVAAGLAADAGLELAPTSDGIVRWTTGDVEAW